MHLRALCVCEQQNVLLLVEDTGAFCLMYLKLTQSVGCWQYHIAPVVVGSRNKSWLNTPQSLVLLLLYRSSLHIKSLASSLQCPVLWSG